MQYHHLFPKLVALLVTNNYFMWDTTKYTWWCIPLTKWLITLVSHKMLQVDEAHFFPVYLYHLIPRDILAAY